MSTNGHPLSPAEILQGLQGRLTPRAVRKVELEGLGSVYLAPCSAKRFREIVEQADTDGEAASAALLVSCWSDDQGNLQSPPEKTIREMCEGLTLGEVQMLTDAALEICSASDSAKRTDPTLSSSKG